LGVVLSLKASITQKLINTILQRRNKSATLNIFIPKNPLARHSRAGGNPARKISGEAAKTAMLPRYAGYYLII
jgi:hypothetical protein